MYRFQYQHDGRWFLVGHFKNESRVIEEAQRTSRMYHIKCRVWDCIAERVIYESDSKDAVAWAKEGF